MKIQERDAQDQKWCEEYLKSHEKTLGWKMLWIAGWEAGQSAARARCAMIADEYADAAERIAQAIRARGAA